MTHLIGTFCWIVAVASLVAVGAIWLIITWARPNNEEDEQ